MDDHRFYKNVNCESAGNEVFVIINPHVYIVDFIVFAISLSISWPLDVVLKIYIQ